MNKEIEIPEGYEARIEGNKVILERKGSEDKRIRDVIKLAVSQYISAEHCYVGDIQKGEIITWLEKQKGQQPAEWSDSAAKEMFIKALERAVEQTKKGYELTDCDKHSWWEDFKVYSGIKPAEWSEEDELMRDAVLNTLERIGDRGTIGMQIDWLKSLCPQPHWKPSEEQMKALKEAVDEHWESDGLHPLYTLYNDLLKLRRNL